MLAKIGLKVHHYFAIRFGKETKGSPFSNGFSDGFQ